MRLVHDHEIESAWVSRLLWTGELRAKQLQGACALEVVERRDKSRMVPPRVHPWPTPPPQFAHKFRVHDAELQPKLLVQLVSPLDLERGGAEDEDPACSVAQEHLLEHQTCLNCLAEPNIVGDQQVDPRHLQGARDRLELEILDRNAAPKRGLEPRNVCRRDRAPPCGVHESVEALWWVKAIGLGQVAVVVKAGARLDFPKDPKLLAIAVILDRREVNDVLGAF
jgi:hypothetical protein